MKANNKVRYFDSNRNSITSVQQAAGLSQMLVAYQEFRNAFLIIPEIQNAISNVSGKAFSPYVAGLKIRVRHISSEKFKTNVVIQIDHLNCPLVAILLDVKKISGSSMSACEVQILANTMKSEFIQLTSYPKIVVSLSRNPQPSLEMTNISWDSIMEMLQRYVANNWSWIQMEAYYEFLTSIRSKDCSSGGVSLAQA